MQATFTPDELTPFTFEEAAEAMEAALADQLKAKPSRETLALALAKTALETGRWKKIHCFNWGNVKAGEQYVGMFTCILLNEVLGGKTVWFAPEGQLVAGPGSALTGQRYAVPPGHPQTRMRAYANRFDGAYSYVEFVSGGRYKAAWQLLLKGDAIGYVHALKQAGYFTADEATYAKGVVSLQKEFIGRLADLPHHEIDHANVPDEAFTAAQTAHNLMVLERALDDMAVLVSDERARGLRDAGLTDEERERLGYDTDPAELAPESEKQS